MLSSDLQLTTCCAVDQPGGPVRAPASLPPCLPRRRREPFPCPGSAVTSSASALVRPSCSGGRRRRRPARPPAGNERSENTFLADPGKKGQEVFLYLGFVDAAVYDAVVGIDGRYQPYLPGARAPRGASDRAAAVAAAHHVVVTYSPYARADLDTAYAATLATIPDGKAKSDGIAFGVRAADAVIAARVDDGRNAPILFTRPPAPGVWRPTPPPAASDGRSLAGRRHSTGGAQWRPVR